MKVERAFTRYFIPFPLKEDLDIPKEIWEPFKSKEINKVTQKFIPGVKSYFLDSKPLIQCYKINQKLKPLICASYDKGDFFQLFIKKDE